MGTFVHLNGHSEYSSDSNATIKELVAAAAADGQGALALTDTNLAAAPLLRAEARRHGIKPIIGLDVRLVENRHSTDHQQVFHLTLLAENRTGWHNLVALYNSSAVPGRSQSFVDHELLALHADGLIALTGGRRGPVEAFLDLNDADTARANFARLESTLGTGRVFLEASSPESAQLLTGVFMGRAVHVVATGRYRQTALEDTEARQTLMDIRAGKEGRGYGEGGWLRTESEMRRQAPDSQAWQNAVTIAATVGDAIHYDAIPEPGGNMPSFAVPDGFQSSGEYLRHLTFRGAGSRFDEISFEAIERLNNELEVIISKGAADSILITHDLIKWCTDNDILTGARGNSSSSLVLYCLGITDINPLTYGLRYERFLRPGRTEIPGLDIDIQASRMQDAHGYLSKRWPDRVARAATHSRVKADTWTRRGLVSEEKAALVDGRFLNRNIHPCAVVIAARDLTDQLPVLPDRRAGHEHELPVANWEAQTLLNEGYLVLNLLGSATLDVVAQAAALARLDRGSPVHLGLLLPVGDDLYARSTPAAWDLITAGDTDGVFGLGAEEAVAAAKLARPRNLTDMAVLTALSGKEERRNRYLTARINRPRLRYYHLEHLTSEESEQAYLCRILAPTHGELVFQEQVMDLFSTVGGFSDVDAEGAWRFLAKKPRDWSGLREKFLAGAVQEKRGRAGDPYSMVFSAGTAEQVFDLIMEAVPFLFSASHAHAYAVRTFQTAWLRAHFPEAFQRVLDEVQPRRNLIAR
ncbi:DNA-directed DNA polymerase (plasmid) [Pseudarthrobacter chlorophenolicus A6]|uniref:DNA-directed DNA polymerase n=1 Tax=Pseudarthrobacter chlorophenolicus (strain ATCC 700700 / DSM 12829 / CIP 107037 / JCM 12360 / KCTC 9906 / NCIMB 13794 / A6) TaxID=452863 RepID=B8HIY7_PSECP|nr:PHP domain-containing protein [Pseudarthrobacter chlorophenolicus]ACL42384.1 DNA-directed DNA polymerase [Pseudarthrobacter chlorophenolicus A6]SDQ17382.1 DNA polymerase-3 subunit alpha [Pseudarthrobacter chlorophenolicus]